MFFKSQKLKIDFLKLYVKIILENGGEHMGEDEKEVKETKDEEQNVAYENH